MHLSWGYNSAVEQLPRISKALEEKDKQEVGRRTEENEKGGGGEEEQQQQQQQEEEPYF
jgi:hypothetical protein